MRADLTEAELAYVAGILDGEGCISIYPKTVYDKRGLASGHRMTRHLQLTVTVNNTSRELMEWMHARLGGHLAIRKSTNHFKDQWSWSEHGRPAAAFLASVERFLIVKRQEAVAGILFGESMHWPTESRGLRGGRFMSDESARLREICYRSARQEKSKGRRPTARATRSGRKAVVVAA